ncbi:hypothetical protein HMPREF3036_00580 [Sutterella sp. KLE1602]|nr:hypothetical protein HMPREF3036_00580 [Sutterella sp. KLE1602]
MNLVAAPAGRFGVYEAELRKQGGTKKVCRAHFVRAVTFRRLCPLKELADGRSESSV